MQVEVSALFKAEGSRPYTEVLGVDVTERDFADAPGGIPYEVRTRPNLEPYNPRNPRNLRNPNPKNPVRDAHPPEPRTLQP
jgi:hypothetical protein